MVQITFQYRSSDIPSCYTRIFDAAGPTITLEVAFERGVGCFLNSETVLFLHQIFMKGLTARMDAWPTLVLGTSLGGN